MGVTLPNIEIAAGTVFLTVERLRDFVTTDLSDASLQMLIDAAFAAIDDTIGPPQNVREFLYVGPNPGDLLYLSKRAESVISVTERARWAPTVLDPTDYELMPSGRTLVRLHTGTTPRWFWWNRVDVTYRGFDDMANRNRVAIELVRLDLTTTAGSGVLTSQTIGTWSESYATSSGNNAYVEQRAAILASLSVGVGIA